MPTTLRRLISIALLLSACQTAETPARVPTPSALAPDRPEALEAAIYPSPQPVLGDGPISLVACPNADGLQTVAALDPQVAVTAVNAVDSGDRLRMQTASDPAWWPQLLESTTAPEPVTAEWFEGGAPQPAVDGPHAAELSAGCGADLVAVSWWVAVCPGACATAATDVPRQHYYLLIRGGRLLVWFIA